ncbi:hypothetical protein [Dyadobacter frigoris]|uniref:Uncharacterized protein n=1 Tax=Dyadobacter frigoris TaxID=2576211 RepID=A0A4V6BKC6_9BACT|nr:hypothetical protein [Dyadobacter frigoris]TKT90323.1 hypothetical protein FDK13_21550 [Dyadobacter frigoris]GLU52562.1 hypothetical protein Dfri01_20230 [Dyadobacter frigoris]
MKLKFILLLLIVSISISCKHSGDVKISVKDTDEEYKFTAYFDEKKTREIVKVIDQNIAPTTISSDEDEIDVTTILDDKTKFDLQYSPGEVIIKFNKNENSKSSYIRIKKMCEEIKKAIGKK